MEEGEAWFPFVSVVCIVAKHQIPNTIFGLKPNTMAWHNNIIVRSTEKGGDDPLWVRERRVRECVMMKVRNV